MKQTMRVQDKRETAEQARRKYSPPVLSKYGTIDQQTQGKSGPLGDGGGTSS